jgi:HPt (histidine-containing phosphotransfer) domain-containing protein
MQLAAFDRAHFDRVTGGDCALQAEIKGLFGEQAAAWMAALSDAQAAMSDTKTLRDMAHTIKGSAAGIGLPALAAASDAVEIAAKGAPDLAQKVVLLRGALDEALQALNSAP